MLSVDRINGVSGDLAIKTPVRVATTANITLSGLQTIDGVLLVAGDRVLVKDQTDAVDNGIWSASTSSWSRALDFDGAYDVVQGTAVPVVSGTVSAGSAFKLDTTSPVIGTSSLSFSVANDFALRADLASTAGGKGAALVGGAAKVVSSITALRALLNTSASQHAFVTGYYAQGDGGGGAYWYDSTDTTSTDNGGTLIVAADGGRWKLAQSFPVSIKQFGAKGDATTDDAPAIQAAIDAHPGGGKLFAPRGFYRCATSLNIHSGLSFFGESCVNKIYGIPTSNERPSYIYIDNDAGILFRHTFGVQLESLSFSDISFGARQSPNTTPRGTAVGFFFSGSNPNDSKHITFNRCEFSNFGGYAIQIHDPDAGGAGFDWNIAPVTMNDCTFYYNTIGIEFNADNADYWQLNGCAFFGNTYGVNCLRSGILVLNQCFGGGGVMVRTTGDFRDSITFIGCQYEQATAMLLVADTMPGLNTYIPINLIGCAIESPIVLSAPCHLVSHGTRYSENIEVTVGGVVIDSFGDSFLPAVAINLFAGSTVQNFVNHGSDLPIGVRGQIYDGKCKRSGSAPPVGGNFVRGDITHNLTPSAGSPEGWMCVTTGTPGTWLPFGQVGYQSNAGSPVGVLTPFFVGEEAFNSAAGSWYKSVGLTNASWVLIG